MVQQDPKLKNTVMNIVENQIKGSDINEPIPYVRRAFNTLSQKYGEELAKEKIAVVYLTEMYEMMKDNRDFDEEHYKEELLKLK